jgi:septal ring factor EnvC (AmiA/AmiB activator)
MEKTMKTIEELDVELELLKSDIEKQYEVLSTLKQRKSFLLTSIASATVRERRDAERRARNAVSAARRKAQRLAEKYDIEWDDDSYRESGEYNHLHYFPQPDLARRVMTTQGWALCIQLG